MQKKLFNQRNISWYRYMWRWHFYAGLFVAPILLISAITGALYVFKPQIDQFQYERWINPIPHRGIVMSPPQVVQKTKEAFPNLEISQMDVYVERSWELTVMDEEHVERILYVDPIEGQVLGQRKKEDWLEIAIGLHKDLLSGKTGRTLVELASSWGFLLLLSGLFLWFPRNGFKLLGLFIPRVHGQRIPWRDFHAVGGFLLFIFAFVLILTGLPWTQYSGEHFDKVSNATGGKIPFQAFVPHKSKLDRTKELSFDKVWSTMKKEPMTVNYSVYLPSKRRDVFTLRSKHGNDPSQMAFLHYDKYSGEKTFEHRWEDSGFFAQLVSYGIAIHEGEFFGLTNQIFCFLGCFSITLSVITGVIMWWKRKPRGALGAPPSDMKTPYWFYPMIVFIGYLLPTVGVSLLLFIGVDSVIKKTRPNELN